MHLVVAVGTPGCEYLETSKCSELPLRSGHLVSILGHRGSGHPPKMIPNL